MTTHSSNNSHCSGSSNEKKCSKSLEARWEEMFQRLADYRQKHGDCLVPNRYSEDTQLGAWVSTQRRHYRLFQSGTGTTPMTQERARRLMELGMAWSTTDPRHVPWESRFDSLRRFVAIYGHAQVPIGWEEDPSLSNWVSAQRQEYKVYQRGTRSRLDKNKVALLNSVGFVWEAQRGGRRRQLQSTQAIQQEKAAAALASIAAAAAAAAPMAPAASPPMSSSTPTPQQVVAQSMAQINLQVATLAAVVANNKRMNQQQQAQVQKPAPLSQQALLLQQLLQAQQQNSWNKEPTKPSLPSNTALATAAAIVAGHLRGSTSSPSSTKVWNESFLRAALLERVQQKQQANANSFLLQQLLKN